MIQLFKTIIWVSVVLGISLGAATMFRYEQTPDNEILWDRWKSEPCYRNIYGSKCLSQAEIDIENGKEREAKDLAMKATSPELYKLLKQLIELKAAGYTPNEITEYSIRQAERIGGKCEKQGYVYSCKDKKGAVLSYRVSWLG